MRLSRFSLGETVLYRFAILLWRKKTLSVKQNYSHRERG
jgi:hypothetical protein